MSMLSFPQKPKFSFLCVCVCVARPQYDTPLVGLGYHQGKDIVFRFIVEYGSVMDFGP